MYPIYVDIYDDLTNITGVGITYPFMTDVSKKWLVSLLWKYTYQIIMFIHIKIFLYIFNNWSRRHFCMFMTVISSTLSHNTIECKWWKISLHIFRIYVSNWYTKLSTQKIWNDCTSSPCSFLFCPHKLFLHLVYISTFYACMPMYPTTNLLVVIVISLKMTDCTTLLTTPFLKTCYMWWE